MKAQGIWLFLFMTFNFSTFAALDVDAGFVARILGASDSKRTILVNQGSETGLEPNQHAKISTSSGMIARAVAVRVSPTRSVWSIYRFFAKDQIGPKVVVKFKVATAVKLTKDESKSLGDLAPLVDKKEEAVPQDPEFAKKQETLKRSLEIRTQMERETRSEDFSALREEAPVSKKLDQDYDWSALNGKKDQESFDDQLDYSSLR